MNEIRISILILDSIRVLYTYSDTVKWRFCVKIKFADIIFYRWTKKLTSLESRKWRWTQIMGKISSDYLVNEKINVHRWRENDGHSSCFCALLIDQFFKTKKGKRFDQYLYIGLKGLEIPFSHNVTVERVQTLKGNVPLYFFLISF